ncbi:hypothetical protein M422DRAFT_243018 [Sphaerobolus stellatus SS14]|nr:hypothetical protein M422DRAFT_243018 [Sphaerobolus stellatus SS14]
MSIPTTQGTQPVDLNYRKFTEGILSELPIEEQTRILRRAEKVYSLRMNNTKIIHSVEFKDPTSAEDTSSTKITGFSQRYTGSQKGKAKDMRPSTMKHRVEQPEIREQIIAEQVKADEQLARHITQNDAETEHIPQFIPRIGTSGKRHADNPIITSAHSVRLSQEKELGQKDAKHKRTGSPSYMNNLPGVYQLRNTIPGGRQASIFPNQNLCATSQLPPSGYLSQKLQQPDSPPYSSSSSSSSSSNSKDINKAREKKRKYKCRLNERASKATSAKISSPRTYDSAANYEEFERWTYEVNNWMDITKFPKNLRVRHIGSFMTGNTSKFYFMHVAPNPKKYTIDSLGRELFDYCFPPRFRQNMRDKFKDASQGRRMIKDYIRYLESLAARVPDLNEFDIVQQLVKKSAPYLQLKWAEAGFTKDFTSLEE